MRAILSLQQLRQIMDRAILGEKITHMAEEYGVERATLTQRLHRRFPEEYAKLAAAGLISSVPSEAARKRRADAADERWANDPAVLEYLHGNGIDTDSGVVTDLRDQHPAHPRPITMQQVADKYGISLTAMRTRVQRARRHFARTAIADQQNQPAQKQNPQEKGNARANQHANAKLEGAPAPAPGQDAHIPPESSKPLSATQLAAQPAAVACAVANPPGAADYSDILTSVEILQDLQAGKRAP